MNDLLVFIWFLLFIGLIFGSIDVIHDLVHTDTGINCKSKLVRVAMGVRSAIFGLFMLFGLFVFFPLAVLYILFVAAW